MFNVITLSTGESLIYDEDAEMFAGKIKWLADEIELILGKDRDAETADYAADIIEEILQDTAKWDDAAREYIAGYLQMHFPEMMNIDGNDLTHEDVKGFPELEAIYIGADRTMEFSFSDCALLNGKQLIACGKYGNRFDVCKIERRFD